MRPEKQRICYDPYARRFVRLPFRMILTSRVLTKIALWLGVERRFPGGVDTILSRVRFVDDCLQKEVAQGAEQVVILGAGYDSRALRFQRQLSNRKVFEVDHPLTQAMKKKKVKQLFGKLPAHVTYVGVDFEKEKFDCELRQNGFEETANTFFIWEGVTKYLTPEAVLGVLSTIARSAAQGSSVVFDYLFKSMISGDIRSDLTQRMLSYQEKKGEPYLFGMAQGEEKAFLAAAGFRHVACTTPAQLIQRYFADGRRGKRMHPFWGIVHATV